MIELKNIVKEWSGTQAVADVSFAVKEGTFTVLLGPSGCGKSTILRMIAGLESPTSGTILIDGEDVTDIDSSRRGISMVFQSYALFPHLSVKENILFGLKVRKVSRKERRRRLHDAAEVVGLLPYLKRKPAYLSGGQRQRVALARTIVSRQPICLMDEPLSNLDARLRAEMRDEIKMLQQRLRLTVIFVTHDQTEAMTMADQIILLQDGSVEQTGTPRELYTSPQSAFAARFIGSPPMNVIDLHTGGIRFTGTADHDGLLGIRPEDILVQRDGEGVPMSVTALDYLGSETLIHLDSGRCRLVAKVNGACTIRLHERVQVSWPPAAAHHF